MLVLCLQGQRSEIVEIASCPSGDTVSTIFLLCIPCYCDLISQGQFPKTWGRFGSNDSPGSRKTCRACKFWAAEPAAVLEPSWDCSCRIAVRRLIDNCCLVFEAINFLVILFGWLEDRNNNTTWGRASTIWQHCQVNSIAEILLSDPQSWSLIGHWDHS